MKIWYIQIIQLCCQNIWIHFSITFIFICLAIVGNVCEFWDLPLCPVILVNKSPLQKKVNGTNRKLRFWPMRVSVTNTRVPLPTGPTRQLQSPIDRSKYTVLWGVGRVHEKYRIHFAKLSPYPSSSRAGLALFCIYPFASITVHQLRCILFSLT